MMVPARGALGDSPDGGHLAASATARRVEQAFERAVPVIMAIFSKDVSPSGNAPGAM